MADGERLSNAGDEGSRDALRSMVSLGLLDPQ